MSCLFSLHPAKKKHNNKLIIELRYIYHHIYHTYILYIPIKQMKQINKDILYALVETYKHTYINIICKIWIHNITKKATPKVSHERLHSFLGSWLCSWCREFGKPRCRDRGDIRVLNGDVRERRVSTLSHTTTAHLTSPITPSASLQMTDSFNGIRKCFIHFVAFFLVAGVNYEFETVKLGAWIRFLIGEPTAGTTVTAVCRVCCHTHGKVRHMWFALYSYLYSGL